MMGWSDIILYESQSDIIAPHEQQLFCASLRTALAAGLALVMSIDLLLDKSLIGGYRILKLSQFD